MLSGIVHCGVINVELLKMKDSFCLLSVSGAFSAAGYCLPLNHMELIRLSISWYVIVIHIKVVKVPEILLFKSENEGSE